MRTSKLLPLLLLAACDPGKDPGDCSTASGVIINEFVANPAGTDAGYEWVELKNTSAEEVDVSGWSLQAWKSESSTRDTDPLPEGTTIPAGGYLLLGDENVAGAEVTLAFDLGSGSGGDALYLVDACGTTVDAAVYGADNADGAMDETGAVASSLAPAPGDDEALARCQDGRDTNLSGEDFLIVTGEQATPGSENVNCPERCEGAATAASVRVVLNEVMANPDGTDTGREWIELYNPGDSDAVICDWSIRWFKSDPETPSGTIILPGDAIVPAGGWLVLAEEDVDFSADVTVGLDLGNGTDGDGVHLVDPDGTVEDAVVYGPPNDDGIYDESGTAATSVADKPGDDEPVARCPDGEDTDMSGEDFQALGAGSGTPGSANLCGGGDACDLATSVTIVINEVMVDPDGADDGKEWLELYNPGTADVDLSGWQVEWYKSSPDSPSGTATLPAGTIIRARDFLLLAENGVSFTPDLVVALDFGNGTDGDGIHLRDCGDTLEDALVYAPPNDDGIYDESGAAATSVADKPGSEKSLARYPDGADSNRSGDDFCVPTSNTPGSSNPSCS